MKRIMLLAALFAAGQLQTPVTSLTINGCGALHGDVRLTVKVVSTGVSFAEPSNTCEAGADGAYTLTFFVPVPPAKIDNSR